MGWFFYFLYLLTKQKGLLPALHTQQTSFDCLKHFLISSYGSGHFTPKNSDIAFMYGFGDFVSMRIQNYW